jgi:hypothetical protein
LLFSDHLLLGRNGRKTLLGFRGVSKYMHSQVEAVELERASD